MNKIMLIGRCVAAPEMRYTQDGKAIAKFTLAVNRRKGKGQENPEADFFRVVAWEKLAEVCSNYLEKGKQIAIEGRMQSGNYTGQDGVKRYTWDVIATDMEMLGSRGDSKPQAQDAPPSDDDNPSMADLGMDQEVPF